MGFYGIRLLKKDIGSAKVIRIQSYRKLNTPDSLMEIIEGESDT